MLGILETQVKIYVWNEDGVLENYTHGMIVAIAEDLEGALKAIRSECDYCMSSFPNDKPTEVVDIGPVVCSPRAWVCYGGG